MGTQLLLADDSPTIAKILQMALQSEPYEIRSVLTADEALRELKANPPFFFLVDLSLPVKNGYELTRIIRRDSKLRNVRVVLLASAFEPVDEVEYQACGADALVKKPFDPAELRAKLRNILDAPAPFPENAHVSGSLSGYVVSESAGSPSTGSTDTRSDLLEPPPSGGDADSILTGLLASSPETPPPFTEEAAPASEAPPPFSGAPPSGEGENRPDPTVALDLSALTASADGSLDLSASFLETPPAAPPASPPPVEAPLSANAQALAAFFDAEIQSQPAPDAPPQTPPPEPTKAPAPSSASPSSPEPGDAFDASLDSIDWNSGPASASLDQWSSSGQPAVAAAGKPADLPPPVAPKSDASSAGFTRKPSPSAGAPSLMFDTGGSSFRFSDDYVNRITRSFSGDAHETVPEQHAAVFPQASDDRARAEPPQAPAGAPAGPVRALGGGAWSENEVQKIEQIVREEVQMVVREVAEKIAWEVIPELAENLIRKELEKVLKEMGQP